MVKTKQRSRAGCLHTVGSFFHTLAPMIRYFCCTIGEAARVGCSNVQDRTQCPDEAGILYECDFFVDILAKIRRNKCFGGILPRIVPPEDHLSPFNRTQIFWWDVCLFLRLLPMILFHIEVTLEVNN